MVGRESYLTNTRLKELERLAKDNFSLVIDNLWDSTKALVTHLVSKANKKHVVYVTSSSHIFDDLYFFTNQNPLEFPAWESLPSEELPPSPDVVGERYHLLSSVKSSSSKFIITSLQAILQKTIPPNRLNKLYLQIKKNEELPFELLQDYFVEMGYHKNKVAADKGEFAVRGGIIDIYPVNSTDPFRIEFWEDKIISIRKYDPISQISIEKVEEVIITPGEELELIAEEKEPATLFDYLGEDTLVIFDNIQDIEDKYVALSEMHGTSTKLFATLDELFVRIAGLQKFYFTDRPLEELSVVNTLDKSSQKISFEWCNSSFIAHRWFHPFIALDEEDPLRFLSENCVIELLYQNESDHTGLADKIPEGWKADSLKGYLSSGFYLDEPHYALIPSTAFTHRYKIRRQKQRSHYHALPVESISLTPGEAVVHTQSGIGRYLGIEKRPNHLGVETEFMLIEYAQGGKLYVPMDNANLVSKYIGATDTPPDLSLLGSSRWQKTYEKTEKAILGYAQDLLKLQANRILRGGFVYPANSDITNQFNEEFPYEETADQMQAIEQVYKDMQSPTPVDRLVCGDVGYGKTEVAMRAAFKAVVDGGKQVAILVPTTMLAMQHYETFSARMSNFPVRIATVSRFRKEKELKETLAELEKGNIDILIGTHRIISKDVKFKDLGLVVIDEEQRFGVKAKEYLKQLRNEVDYLTLSATPIPRTLYLSLVGARDLSVINTPPEDRLPIQSIVCSASEDVIKNALMRELARDGQAYVIHNRVETIYEMGDKIRSLLPSAKIVVGHGQMGSGELDGVFHAFKSGAANILVATSIVENGIDIPRANTILIDRADRFGLADLYQMRGRVGRWNRKAYCYFMVPSTKEMSEVARQRLSALTQGNNGMKIAMHDLEIRGAGNILGTEQSGHVSAIGFHLYCKLLRKAVAALKNNKSSLSTYEVKIEFPFDACIPQEYVSETSLRMDIYQRLGDVESKEDVDMIFDELVDRFGPLPVQSEWLRCLSRVRLFASRNHFTTIKLTKTVLTAEQYHGKKNKIVKKMIINVPKEPKKLEEIVCHLLSTNFPHVESV